MRVSSIVLLGLAMVPAVHAQDGVMLRFHPQVGTRVQFISETGLNTVLVGFPSVPDSTVIESTWRTVTTQRLVEIRGGENLLAVRFDSSRARARIGTAPRADVIMPGVEGLSGRWAVSERFATATLSGGQGGDSAYMDALTANVGGFRFALSDTPVPVGGEWTGPFTFPLGAHVSASGKIVSSGSIGGRATAVLDSLVPRGADTLAYITVRAVANPTTVHVAAEGGVGTGTFTGGFAASLLWSTGWNAFVSSVTNGIVTGTVSINRAEGPVNGGLSINIAARQRVRL